MGEVSSRASERSYTPGGPLAQLVEQLTLNQRAVGSTPTRPTKNNKLETFPQRSQVNEVSVCGGGFPAPQLHLGIGSNRPAPFLAVLLKG